MSSSCVKLEVGFW